MTGRTKEIIPAKTSHSVLRVISGYSKYKETIELVPDEERRTEKMFALHCKLHAIYIVLLIIF